MRASPARRAKMREYAARWRGKDPEHARKVAADWRERNRESIREYMRLWRADHREELREYERKRRADLKAGTTRVVPIEPGEKPESNPPPLPDPGSAPRTD